MRKLYLLLFINLISCGGGGGGSSEAPVPPPITTTPTIASACTSEGGAPTVSQQLQWPHYSSDQYASRYLDTDKLTETNFSNLTLAWRWTSPTENLLAANSDLEAFWNESTPIMINGVLFVSSQFNHIVAINAETGQAIWTFDPQSYQAGRPPNHGFVHRGVAYWEKDNDKRIFVGTLDSFLYSIDACTGEVDPNFNNGGRVNLLEGLGRAVNNDHYGVNSPPLVCKDTVVVGSSVMDYPAQYLNATSMAPGDVRAYDAITGQLKWQFHVIPHEGEFGADTWENTSYLEGAGVNVWSTFSCDEELGMVSLPLTTPTNDHFGGDRLGDNLFAESVVALDIETGDRKWH
ncbi:MAG: PQQ-binding-like beta-propeller repeat protein, partial [Gammaproteobacteria bacterium]|nr:PQQ-binding-like beta-propeller repeat protein [Gammaproteobacteria bacterium]